MHFPARMFLPAFLSFALATLSHAAPAPAVSASPYCGNANARRIERPVHAASAGSPGAETFSYTYAVGGAEDEAQPWIVVLPGGPGQGAISMPLALPSGFRLLRIDPRGVGCNAGLPADALSSELVAADVAAVIRKEKIRSYFLYGASYGTITATILAHQLENDGGIPPRAVILEGVIGRAFRPGEYLRAFTQRWDALWPELSAETRAELSGASLPFGLSREWWAGWLISTLYVGVPVGGTHDAALDQIELLRNEESRVFVKKRIEASAGAPDANRLRVFREVTCREIAPDMRDLQFDFDFVRGRLVPRAPGFCAGIEPGPLFDAERYPLRSPIYYFSGALDPATPPFQARYHFERQRRAPRTLVTLPRGGHLALSLNLGDCSQGVWEAIRAGKPLPEVFGGCDASPSPRVEVEQDK